MWATEQNIGGNEVDRHDRGKRGNGMGALTGQKKWSGWKESSNLTRKLKAGEQSQERSKGWKGRENKRKGKEQKGNGRGKWVRWKGREGQKNSGQQHTWVRPAPYTSTVWKT